MAGYLLMWCFVLNAEQVGILVWWILDHMEEERKRSNVHTVVAVGNSGAMDDATCTLRTQVVIGS